MSDAAHDGAVSEPPRRQAPRYGEYATPEEVAALRGPEAAPIEPVAPAAPPPPTGRPIPGAPPAGRTRPATWDAVITIALLAFGAFNIAQSAIGYLDLPSFLHAVLQTGGYGDVTVPDSVRPWGIALIAIDVVVYLGAIWLSVHRIRRGRVAIWVPLVAAVAAATIGAIVILAVLAGTGTLDVLQNQG